MSDEKNLLGALSYPIWIIAILILVTDERKKDFSRYHAYQALFFNIVSWTVLVAFSFVLIGYFLFPIWLAITCIYAYKTYQGEVFSIPVVTNLTKKFAPDLPTFE